MQKHRKKQE